MIYLEEVSKKVEARQAQEELFKQELDARWVCFPPSFALSVVEYSFVFGYRVEVRAGHEGQEAERGE